MRKTLFTFQWFWNNDHWSGIFANILSAAKNSLIQRELASSLGWLERRYERPDFAEAGAVAIENSDINSILTHLYCTRKEIHGLLSTLVFVLFRYGYRAQVTCRYGLSFSNYSLSPGGGGDIMAHYNVITAALWVKPK